MRVPKPFLKALLIIVPSLAMYTYFCQQLNFTQDDAYITYRYVANYLNGNGLVYNIGERVEGFTNFGWTIYLILWGALHVSYIAVSKIMGFLLGGGIIVLTYLVARIVFPDPQGWFAWLATALVSVNQSLAYWSPAGLEAAAFGFLVMLSMYLYLKRSWGLMASLALAVWVRPEGVLIAGLLIITETIVERRVPRFSFLCAVLAFMISIPLAVFKVVYFGSILPNPFYAKTGWNVEQLVNGLEYTGTFLSQYGFYGVGFVLTLIFFKRLSRPARSIWWFSVLYIIYLVVIGGDVLKVHRFFLPIFGAAAIVTSLALWVVTGKHAQKTVQMVVFTAAIPLIALSTILPKYHINTYRFCEKALTAKMSFLATQMRNSDTSDFSVALSTIGVFGYTLLDHEIIDMLGLTDTTIARHSQDPIPGMATTWKEQKHNSRYLLTKAPDYIVFSTGIKASAPAERALLLYSQFLRSYRAIGWFYEPSSGTGREIIAAFKRMHEISGEIVATYPVEYVQYYSQGQTYASKLDYAKAIQYFDSAISVSPQPFNLCMLCDKAFCHTMLGQRETAIRLLSDVLAEDSLIFQAHKILCGYAQMMQDSAGMSLHRRWLAKLAPWYLKSLDSLASREGP